MKFSVLNNGPRTRCCACHQRRLVRGASPNSLLVLPAPAPSRVTLRKKETSLAALSVPLSAAASQIHTHGPPLHCPIAERVFITTDGGRPVTLDIRLPSGCAVAAADVDMPRVAVAAADGQMWFFEVSLPPSELFFDEAETAQAQHCVILQLEASVASLRLSGETPGLPRRRVRAAASFVFIASACQRTAVPCPQGCKTLSSRAQAITNQRPWSS